MAAKRKAAQVASASPRAGDDEQRIMSVRLSTSVHRRARIFSVTNGTTLAAVLNEALDEYLKKRGA